MYPPFNSKFCNNNYYTVPDMSTPKLGVILNFVGGFALIREDMMAINTTSLKGEKHRDVYY